MSAENLILHPLDTSQEWPPLIITIKEPGKEDKPYGTELCRIYPEGKNKELKHSESERLDFLLKQIALNLEDTQNTHLSVEKKKTFEEIFIALRSRIQNGQDIELPRVIWEGFSSNPEYFAIPVEVAPVPRWEIPAKHIVHP